MGGWAGAQVGGRAGERMGRVRWAMGRWAGGLVGGWRGHTLTTARITRTRSLSQTQRHVIRAVDNLLSARTCTCSHGLAEPFAPNPPARPSNPPANPPVLPYNPQRTTRL